MKIYDHSFNPFLVGLVLIVFFTVLIQMPAFSQNQITGLAPAQLSTLDSIDTSIQALEQELSLNNSQEIRDEIARLHFAYSLAEAEFNNVREGNEPFYLEGNSETAVLLIHGFSASPHEVKELAEYLHSRGDITVYAPLLGGHGTSAESFGSYTWEDWFSPVERGYLALSTKSDQVYVGGISLGGNFALELAKTQPVSGAFTIGAPLFFRNKFVNTANVLQYIIDDLPNDKLSIEDRNYYYYERSVASIAELSTYLKTFRDDLNQVNAPVLMIQNDHDRTIDPESALHIYNQLGSSQKRLESYHGDSHIIIDQETKKRAFQEILEFIQT